MASFVTVADGTDDVLAEHINQLVQDFQGLRNIPISVTGINDSTNYALTLRNSGTAGRGLLVLSSTGSALLTVTDNGIVFPALPSPHFTAPVIDSGGLTITAGGLTVTAGGVGIGGGPQAGISLDVYGLIPNGGTSQAAIQTTAAGGGTTETSGIVSQASTQAAAFTAALAAAFHAVSPGLGAGSAITLATGLSVDTFTVGTNRVGVDIANQTGGGGVNLGLRNAGGALVNGTSTTLGFFGTTPAVKQTVTGSRAGNAALASLMGILAGYGMVTDSTTA